MLFLGALDPSQEQVDKVKEAGFKVEEIYYNQNFRIPMGSRLVMALIGQNETFQGWLSPPLCPWCASMMEAKESVDKLVFTCPQCGGQETHTRTPPKEEGDAA
jgi:hypothetical protein